MLFFLSANYKKPTHPLFRGGGGAPLFREQMLWSRGCPLNGSFTVLTYSETYIKRITIHHIHKKNLKCLQLKRELNSRKDRVKMS